MTLSDAWPLHRSCASKAALAASLALVASALGSKAWSAGAVCDGAVCLTTGVSISLLLVPHPKTNPMIGRRMLDLRTWPSSGTGTSSSGSARGISSSSNSDSSMSPGSAAGGSSSRRDRLLYCLRFDVACSEGSASGSGCDSSGALKSLWVYWFCSRRLRWLCR